MEIFLMVLSLSLAGVLASAVLFAAASRDARRVEARLAPAVARDEERFFVMQRAPRTTRRRTAALP